MQLGAAVTVWVIPLAVNDIGDTEQPDSEIAAEESDSAMASWMGWLTQFGRRIETLPDPTLATNTSPLTLDRVSDPHLQAIEREYESLRRRRAYNEPRLVKRFRRSDFDSIRKTATGKLSIEIDFTRDAVGEEKWKEYGNQILKLNLALRKRNRAFDLQIEPRYLGYVLTISNEADVVDAIFYPSSLQFAQSPINVRSHRTTFNGDSTPRFPWKRNPSGTSSRTGTSSLSSRITRE